MEEVFGAVYASLHVRVMNKGAFHLYTETLGYQYAFPLTSSQRACQLFAFEAG